MRWVVSLIVCMLVLPLGLALDISFSEPSQQYFSDPVNITFTTDTASTCTYSLNNKLSQPDFSCEPTSCSFMSCDYTCAAKTKKKPLETDILLTPYNANNGYFVSIDVSPGYYDFFASCTDDFETTTKKISFLYHPDTFRLEWSLLTRERFAKTQSSTYYAYLYGHEPITSGQAILTLPDKTNKTTLLEGFTPGDGYLFSYDLDEVSVSGRHTISFIFNYGDNQEYILSKEFIVSEPASFDVSIDSPYAYDITFIDPISNVTSFSYQDVKEDKLLVPATRNHVLLKTNDVFSVQLQNILLDSYYLDVVQDDTYVLETETIGQNKPLHALSTQLFYLNDTPEYISKIQFNYSAFNIQDPRSLQIFKADATSQGTVDLSTGEFYKFGSRQRPLYIDENNNFAYIYVNDFSLFALVKERVIGEEIVREPETFYIDLTTKNISLEGIHRDTWTFSYGSKEYSFLINTIDGAIVYFEFSPNGDIKRANIGSTIRVDINDDETDDISLYVKAITPKKIVFSAYLLTQPTPQDSSDSIIGKDTDGKYKLYVASPWFFVYVGLAVLVLFFGIIWLFVHGHKKSLSTGLSKEEKERLDRSGNENLPILEFIVQLKEKGLDTASIRTRLDVAGWPKDIIDKVLERDGLQEQAQSQFQPQVQPRVQPQEPILKSNPITIQKTPTSTHQATTVVPSIPSQPILNQEEQSLLAYVKKQLALGATKETILHKLREVRWKEETIQKIFSLVT